MPSPLLEILKPKVYGLRRVLSKKIKQALGSHPNLSCSSESPIPHVPYTAQVSIKKPLATGLLIYQKQAAIIQFKFFTSGRRLRLAFYSLHL